MAGFFDRLWRRLVGAGQDANVAKPSSTGPPPQSLIFGVGQDANAPISASARASQGVVFVVGQDVGGTPRGLEIPKRLPLRKQSLDLSADDFLPIADSELREAAKKVTFGGAWFGRRDLIPPADDLRTKLIDRA